MFNINWDGLTKERYDLWMSNHEWTDDCLGNVRVGETCFEFVEIEDIYDEYKRKYLTVNCYAYGIDDGYGETEDGTPYCLCDGGFDIFLNTIKNYEDFVKEVNNEIIRFFVYSQKEIVDKAMKPLLVW